MCESLETPSILELSNSLSKRLGLKFDLTSYDDLDINFIEAVFSFIAPKYVLSHKSLPNRFQCILSWLSSTLGITLDHISVDTLVLFEPSAVNNLLELLNLCLDGVTITDDEYATPDQIQGPSIARSSPRMSLPALTPCSSPENDLAETRRNYLHCKLLEMFQPCSDDESKDLDTANSSSHSPSPDCRRRVNFVDADSSASSTDTLEAPESTPELESGRCEPRPPRQYASWSRSILLPQEIPLKRSRTAPRRISSPNSPPCPSGSSETKRRFRWSRSVPGYKLPCRNGTVLLETLMEQFPGLQLTRETKNYVRNKLEKYFGANRLQPETAASEDPLELQFSRKIADVETRQHRRLSCLEREAEHTERLRNLKQAQAFERHLAGELHQRRVQDALARRYYDQHVQQLRARKLAQKAHEERIFKRVFDVAVEREKRYRFEDRQLVREARQKEAALRDSLLTNIEHNHVERLRLLHDERRKQQDQLDLEEKVNRTDKLRAKLEIRQKLTNQIKELEGALLTQTDPQHFRERDGNRALYDWSTK